MPTQHTRISILGLGLLGSSVARACKQFIPGSVIHAYDINPLALQYGKQHGFVDQAFDDAKNAMQEADKIIIAAPPSASVDLIYDIAPLVPSGALVMDVASVKSPVAAAMKEALPESVAFMPVHPIAGSEQVGVAAGRADLFAGKRIIMTPETPEDAAIDRASDFWEALGGHVEYMPAEIHDMVYAYVSHLPQLLAFAAKPLFDQFEGELPASPSFRQFTRLCVSDRRLWDDIFVSNKAELDQALARFLVMFSVIRKELFEGAKEHAEKYKDLEPLEESEVIGELLPRVIASCLVGTIAQESASAGFNFIRFAGSGFVDFTATLKEAPDKHLEDISKYALQVVAAMDEMLSRLTEWVVIKSS